MSKSKYNTEKIEKYLSEEMPEDEKREFRKEIKEDTSLASEIELYKEVNHALKQEDEFEFTQLIDEVSNEYNNKVRKIKTYKKIGLVAASLIIVAGLSVVLQQILTKPTPLELYTEYYQPYPSLITKRSAETKPVNLYEQALVLYENEKYEKALEILNNFPDTYAFKKHSIFYAGILNMEMQEYDKAINCFQLVIAEQNWILSDHANWYLGLCYLKTENIEKATEQFEKVVRKAAYKRKEAAGILETIQ